MDLIIQTLEAAVLAAALTLDGFAAGFAYGAERIRIPLSSALIVDLVCTAMLALSLLLGEAVRALIPAGTLKLLCFGILALLGLCKCFDHLAKSRIRRRNAPFLLAVYASPEAADADRSKVLTAREALSLAFALSLDGLAAGFGAALGSVRLSVVILLSLIAALGALQLGAKLGESVARRVTADLSWISGAALILLALTKL